MLNAPSDGRVVRAIATDHAGKEVARYSGYRSVKEMTAFFRQPKR